MEDRLFELLAPEPDEVRLSRSMFRMWNSLDKLHRDISLVARHSPQLPLSDVQGTLINEVLKDAQHLLAKQNYATMLSLVPEERATFGDVLTVVGAHKAAVRAFLVNVLGESGHSF